MGKITVKKVRISDTGYDEWYDETVECDVGKTSDGYHTFDELYQHRNLLYCAIANIFDNSAWKSRRHDDGTEIPGWFISGLYLDDNSHITYHLPDEMWNLLAVQEYPTAPPYDGHTSSDVIDRLEQFNKNYLTICKALNIM